MHITAVTEIVTIDFKSQSFFFIGIPPFKIIRKPPS